MKTTLINCTQADLTILASDGKTAIDLPRSSFEAVVQLDLDPRPPIEFRGSEIELWVRRTGEVVGLPGPMPNTIYVVSTMVADASYGRLDLAVPGELVRDATGRPIACRGLYLSSPPTLGG